MPRLFPARLLVLVFLLVGTLVAGGPTAAAAQVLQGRVVGITDGDTLTILTADNQHVRIRLAEIDAPERGQPYGKKAKEVLSELAFGKDLTVKVTETDRYGRGVARVFDGTTDINVEMIRRGAAWAYRDYITRVRLFTVEAEAREARRGLWALPEGDRVAPWEWRRPPKVEDPITKILSRTDGPEFTCGAKRTCGQMSSCAEARHYLAVCGLSRLDGDHDGIPCESLCRR